MGEEEEIDELEDLEVDHSYISESHCLWCKGFSEGIDNHWNWVRTALLKMMDKKELQDTKIIPKLQKVIEDLTPEEVGEFLELEQHSAIVETEDGKIIVMTSMIKTKSEEKPEDADMVGFKLTMSDNKDEEVKVDLKRTNAWDTWFLMRKLSVISKWCLDCSELFEKLYHDDEDDEDFDEDEIIDNINNLVSNINRQVNKMNIWFGFKEEISHGYFKSLEKFYNIPSMKDREVHRHLRDDMDLMDRYKELLYEI